MIDKPEPDKVVLLMPRELTAQIDDYRFEHRLLSRAAAIRALIEIGLRHAPRHRNGSGPS